MTVNVKQFQQLVTKYFYIHSLSCYLWTIINWVKCMMDLFCHCMCACFGKDLTYSQKQRSVIHALICFLSVFNI